jgi:hypothetical protein
LTIPPAAANPKLSPKFSYIGNSKWPGWHAMFQLTQLILLHRSLVPIFIWPLSFYRYIISLRETSFAPRDV